MTALKTIDEKLLRSLYSLPYKKNPLTGLLIFVGDGPFWMLVLGGLTGAALIGLPGNWNSAALFLTIGLFVGHLFLKPLKTRITRRRPYAKPDLGERLGIDLVNRDPGHGGKELESFPSGHGVWTTIGVFTLGAQLGLPYFLATVWLIPVMMILRPYLGVHYPSDTAAGVIVGLSASLISLGLFSVLWPFHLSFWSSPFYRAGFGLFVLGFIFLGYKSWLKRV